MSRKFWNWLKNEQDRTLFLDGYIAENSWFDDDITPKQFKSELYSSDGNVTVMLNSPGGDVFAASQIYTMLKEYPGHITVKIEGLAASAASVIAMAADEIFMSPVAMMMIHNPATIVFGEVADLQSGIAMLSEVKESIINAYEQKTGLSRAKISHMMDAESWFNAWKAVELGFADKVLYTTEEHQSEPPSAAYIFDRMTVTNALARKLPRNQDNKPEPETGTPLRFLEKRLSLLKH
ncbi:MAG: Clp protease ClpP [Syntrophomonadaceae bacterium]|nr:Clp protease ClpP [Syntrophomonadaceae bacterium]